MSSLKPISVKVLSSPQSSPKRTRKNSSNKRSFDKKNFFKAILENNVILLTRFSFNQNELNSVDIYGWSGLMMAASAGSLECVRFLLDNNADTTIEDRAHNDALSLAHKSNHNDIVRMIQDHEAKRCQLLTQDVINICDDPEDCVEVEDNSIYCEVCRISFSKTTAQGHMCSIVHKLNDRSDFVASKRYHIPDSNIGFKMMVRQGWDREQGLGPAHNIGPSFPVKTTIRSHRKGLGTKQEPARITHFSAFDSDAVKDRRRPSPTITHIYTKRDILRKAHQEKRKEKRLRQELS